MFECSFCPSRFPTQWALAGHTEAVHTGRTKAYRCLICKHAEWTVTSLKSHLHYAHYKATRKDLEEVPIAIGTRARLDHCSVKGCRYKCLGTPEWVVHKRHSDPTLFVRSLPQAETKAMDIQKEQQEVGAPAVSESVPFPMDTDVTPTNPVSVAPSFAVSSSTSSAAPALYSDVLQTGIAQTPRPLVEPSFYISPTKFSGINKQAWELPEVTKAVTIIGDSNLARMSRSPISDLEIFSFSGAKSQHIAKLLQNYKFTSQPSIIILSFGINDRDNSFTNHTSRNLLAIEKICSRKFPSTQIYIPQLNFHPRVRTQNIIDFNKHIASSNFKIPTLPYFPTSEFRVTSDLIHWTDVTANKLLKHWILALKNLGKVQIPLRPLTCSRSPPSATVSVPPQ